MEKTNRFKQILTLFLTFLKIGAFTFGGGYAMIPIIQEEVVEKRKWATDQDILDILSISESTPGPISINSATYIGFKVAGFWGSFFATFGLVLPSFVIILIISYFYETFMSWTIVQAAFKGLKVGVIILLVHAVLKLKKAIPNSFISALLFIATLIGMLCISFFEINISCSSIIFIGLGMLVGIVISLISKQGEKK